jgi:hypothetical protein
MSFRMLLMLVPWLAPDSSMPLKPVSIGTVGSSALTLSHDAMETSVVW